MAKAIWKFALPVDGAVEMPEGAKVLTVGTQRGEAVLWAEVDPGAPKTVRRFDVYGTGHSMPDEPGRYVGTFMMQGGALVIHVYDKSTT